MLYADPYCVDIPGLPAISKVVVYNFRLLRKIGRREAQSQAGDGPPFFSFPPRMHVRNVVCFDEQIVLCN